MRKVENMPTPKRQTKVLPRDFVRWFERLRAAGAFSDQQLARKATFSLLDLKCLAESKGLPGALRVMGPVAAASLAELEAQLHDMPR